MTTGIATILRIGCDNIEIIDNFCLLESTIKNKGIKQSKNMPQISSCKVAKKALENMFRCHNISIP